MDAEKEKRLVGAAMDQSRRTYRRLASSNDARRQIEKHANSVRAPIVNIAKSIDVSSDPALPKDIATLAAALTLVAVGAKPRTKASRMAGVDTILERLAQAQTTIQSAAELRMGRLVEALESLAWTLKQAGVKFQPDWRPDFVVLAQLALLPDGTDWVQMIDSGEIVIPAASTFLAAYEAAPHRDSQGERETRPIERLRKIWRHQWLESQGRHHLLRTAADGGSKCGPTNATRDRQERITAIDFVLKDPSFNRFSIRALAKLIFDTWGDPKKVGGKVRDRIPRAPGKPPAKRPSIRTLEGDIGEIRRRARPT